MLLQVESMVEIQHTNSESSSRDLLVASGASEDSLDDGKYRLIYSKSKVYVNPTAYARDNIPGFVALVKKVRVLTAAPLRLVVTPCVG